MHTVHVLRKWQVGPFDFRPISYWNQCGPSSIDLYKNDVKCGKFRLHEIWLALQKCLTNQISCNINFPHMTSFLERSIVASCWHLVHGLTTVCWNILFRSVLVSRGPTIPRISGVMLHLLRASILLWKIWLTTCSLFKITSQRKSSVHVRWMAAWTMHTFLYIKGW